MNNQLAENQPTASRRLAHKLLLRVFEVDAFLDHLIDAAFARSDFTQRDRGLVSELCYGVTRYALYLDSRIQKYLKQPISDMLPPARMALRMGAYQLLFMRVPAHSAVNESVNLIRQTQLRGMINAVLRKLAAETEPMPDNADVLTLPSWITGFVKSLRGTEGLALWAKAINQPAPVSIRCRPNRSPRHTVAQDLSQEARSITERLDIPEILEAPGLQSPITHPSYQNGTWTLQDGAASLVSMLLDPQPHERILDLCEAAGGNTCHFLDLAGPTASVVAVDQHPSRSALIQNNAKRLGLEKQLQIVIADATDEDALRQQIDGPFDRVLLDAPCSGLGTLRRHPEIRHRKSPTPDAALLAVQQKLLHVAATFVKPGGTLVYSVCTVTYEEGPGQIKRFLTTHPEFSIKSIQEPLIPFSEPLLNGRAIRTWTDLHGVDGFFAVSMTHTLVASKSVVD